MHIDMELKPLPDHKPVELGAGSWPPYTCASLERECIGKCVVSQVYTGVPEEVQGLLGKRAVGVGLEEGAPRCGTLVEHLVGNELGVDLEELAPLVLVPEEEGD